MDFRKIIIIFVIAILFSVFVFSSIDAIYPSPEWDEYCQEDFRSGMINDRMNFECDYNVSSTEHDTCKEDGGQISYEYDYEGCPSSHQCDPCKPGYEDAREKHSMIIFIVSAIAGLGAIILSIYTPIKKDIYRWISTGFMLGGLFVLFFGTMSYYGDMARFIRPIVILAELIIVIYLAIRKLGDASPHKRAVRKR